MDKVTEPRTPVDRPARVIDIYPGGDGEVTMQVTTENGDSLSTWLTVAERAELIKALGGMA